MPPIHTYKSLRKVLCQTKWQILLLFTISLSLPAQEAQTVKPEPEENAKPESIEGVIVSDREKVNLVKDSDVAEAVDRRPDLQFQNVTIDGEKATVDLSEIPANSILTAEISKAATPDLDADTRGGGLNLRSKPTYDLEKRTVEGSLSFQLNPYDDTLESEASFTYGQPLEHSGFIFTVAVEKGRDINENYNQDWNLVEVDGRDEFVLRDQTVQLGQVDYRELNVNMTYDFKINGHIRLYFKTDGIYLERDSIHPRLTTRYENGVTEFVNEEYAIVRNADSRRVMGGGSFERKQYTLSTGAYIDYDAFSIDYFVSYQKNDVLEPDWQMAEFLLQPVDIRYDWTRRYAPVFTSLEGEPDLQDPRNYNFAELRESHWDDQHGEWIARINALVPFKWGAWSGALKGGAKTRRLDSSIDADVNVYTGYDGSFTIADVLGSYRKNGLINGLYEHGPFPGVSETRAFFSENSDKFEYNVTRSREVSDPNSWDVTQQISAGYMMGFVKRGPFRAIVGLRAEQTDMSYDAFQLETDESGNYLSTIEVSDNSSYTKLFPGVHGRYDLNHKFSFIGSWTNTIQRPGYASLVPRRNVDHEEQYISEGNPDLNPTMLTNYNAAIDYKLNTRSMLSLELFRLELEDTVFFEVTSVTEGPFAGYDRGSNSNGPSAETQGLRLIWNQDLADWWRLLDGFRYSAKYTWQNTETEYPARPGEIHPMTGYADNEIELILTYELARIFAQLSIDYRDNSLSWLHEETWRDQHRKEDYDMDFSLSWQLSDNLRVLIDVNHLLEHRRGQTYRGVPERPAGYVWGARHYSLGIRYQM